MVTVIQKAPGNTFSDILGALTTVLSTIEANRKTGQEADLLKAALLKGQGEFVPAPAQPRSFLDTLFGGSSAPDTIRIGDSTYRFQPYQELGEAGARALGLTTPVTESYAPLEHLPLDDTPAGPLLQTLPTPSTVTTDTVPPAMARLRLSPKTTEALTLEQLKDAARLKREQAAAAARRDELEFLESGRDYRKELGVEGRRGTGTSDNTDMKVDDALAKLKDLRSKPYFPGQSAAALDRVEQLVNRLKTQEHSHVTPAITTQLKRLELQLNRAQRRESGTPRPQTPPSPAPSTGRQSSTNPVPSGPITTSDGPSPEMLATYRTYYETMTPEEAEQDLKATLTTDPTLRSLVSQAKQQAYVTRFPDRPLQLQVPPSPPPAAAAPTAPRQESAAPAAPQTPQAAPRQTPQTPQTPQAMMQRLVSYYETMTDQDLAQEARRLERPERLDALTPYRQHALTQVLEARKTRPQPAPPAPPTQAMHQKIIEHYHGQYQHLSTSELLAEQQRLIASDPLGRDVRTSLQLSAINTLILQRQAPPPSKSTPGADAEP